MGPRGIVATLERKLPLPREQHSTTFRGDGGNVSVKGGSLLHNLVVGGTYDAFRKAIPFRSLLALGLFSLSGEAVWCASAFAIRSRTGASDGSARNR